MNDVSLLRKQVAAVDRRLKQMRISVCLSEKIKRDQILNWHFRIAPAVSGSDDAEKNNTIYDLEQQMNSMKCAILDMGRRVQHHAELPDSEYAQPIH